MGSPGPVYTLWVSRVAPTRGQNRQPSLNFDARHITVHDIMSDNVSSGSLTAPAATSGGDQPAFAAGRRHLLAAGDLCAHRRAAAVAGRAGAGHGGDQPDYVRVPEHGGRPDGLAGSTGPAVGGVREPSRREGLPGAGIVCAETSAMSAAGITLVIVPIMTIVIAGILLAIFNALLGGSAQLQAGGGGPEPRRRHLARAAVVHLLR